MKEFNFMNINLKIIFYLTVICLFFGCASRDDALQFFVDTRNFDIGRQIEKIPLGKPISIKDFDEYSSEFTYEFFNSKMNNYCRWKYNVHKVTHKVQSWSYVSDKSYCFFVLKFGMPW